MKTENPLPLVARLALASSLGVAAAMLLAGAGMLLPSPAHAAPSEAKEGMLLLRARGGGDSRLHTCAATGK